MKFDDTRDELQVLLQKNRDKQDELEQRLKKLAFGEEKILQLLREDGIAVECLYNGWTGEDAEKYIMRSLEETETIRKKYAQAFSQEKERLWDEMKKLQEQEQDISANLKSMRG